MWGPCCPRPLVSSPFLPQEAMAVTSQTPLHGPARHSCTSGPSNGMLSPSHGLNVSACGTSLVAVAAAMAMMTPRPIPFSRHPPSLCAQSRGCGEVLLHGGKEGVGEHIGCCVVHGAVGRAGRLLLHDPVGPILLHVNVHGQPSPNEKTCWTSGWRQGGGSRGDDVDAMSTWRRRAVSFSACWSLVWSCSWVISKYLVCVVVVVLVVVHGHDGCYDGQKGDDGTLN